MDIKQEEAQAKSYIAEYWKPLLIGLAVGVLLTLIATKVL